MSKGAKNYRQTSLSEYHPYSHLNKDKSSLAEKIEDYIEESAVDVQFVSPRDLAAEIHGPNTRRVSSVLPDVAEHSVRIEATVWSESGETIWKIKPTK